MANTLKKSAAQLKDLAGTTTQDNVPTEGRKRKGGGPRSTVLIGAHFPRAVRRSLAQLQADPRNDGKKINDLLAEALNDLFAKYNVPQTANIDRNRDA
ncbi:MAG: hypothetical protein M3Z21_10645 [Pseudomonadota bacterium]|nr:hypothetical protein [Pseudomonadota bacterium]